MHTPQATLAALCIFNGLRLSPLLASPDPELTLVGPRIAPRFDQCRAYLSRFFDRSSTPLSFAPLEVFNGAVAPAQWIRGAVGILQHSLYMEYRIDVADAADVDPAAWFERLEDMAALFNDAEGSVPLELLCPLIDTWQEPDFIPKEEDSRPFFLSRYYGQARTLRDEGAVLAGVPAISKARQTRKLEEGQNLPLPIEEN